MDCSSLGEVTKIFILSTLLTIRSPSTAITVLSFVISTAFNDRNRFGDTS